MGCDRTTQQSRSIPFFPVMARAGIALAEARGLTVTTDKPSRTLYLEGNNKTTAKAVAKEIDALWTSAWDAFKDWKATTTAQRKVWYQTNHGKREMLAAELAFFKRHFATGGVL